jgi:hypothetical protein
MNYSQPESLNSTVLKSEYAKRTDNPFEKPAIQKEEYLQIL